MASKLNKYEILQDFLFNNSKRIINVIENPMQNNELNKYLYSQELEDEETNSHNLKPKIGLIEPDNSIYKN